MAGIFYALKKVRILNQPERRRTFPGLFNGSYKRLGPEWCVTRGLREGGFQRKRYRENYSVFIDLEMFSRFEGRILKVYLIIIRIVLGRRVRMVVALIPTGFGRMQFQIMSDTFQLMRMEMSRMAMERQAFFVPMFIVGMIMVKWEKENLKKPQADQAIIDTANFFQEGGHKFLNKNDNYGILNDLHKQIIKKNDLREQIII